MLIFRAEKTKTKAAPSPPSQALATNHIVLWLVIVALWMTLYPYAGMRHDARLYTLQAQGQMNPELFGQDIFLKYGSQDNYTFFTPVYAALCSALGIEHAAALLTISGQLLFLAASWLLAKYFTSGIWATMTVAIILIIPGNYGSDFIFSHMETFITPRIFAEAFGLFSILSFLKGERTLTAVLIVLAMLTHPIMGMAVVGFFGISLGLNNTRTAALMLATSVVAGSLVIVSPLREHLQFDESWLQIVEGRAPCLFLRNWVYADLARLTAPAGTLLLASLVLPEHSQRRFALVALLTGLFGLIINFTGADLLRIVLVTQGQAWRWLWLATVLALIVFPPLLRTLWSRGPAGQTTALLLIATWLVRNESFALGIALLGSMSGAALTLELGRLHHWRLYQTLAVCTLIATGVWMTAVGNLYADMLVYTFHWPNWIDEWLTFWESGPLPAVTVATVIWIINSGRRWLELLVITATLAFVVWFGKYSWENWTYEEYSNEVQAAMSTWRQLIPPGVDVLWMDGPPTPVWMALQRPSYLSSIQTTVTLFSRKAAFELRDRAASVDQIFPEAQPMSWTGVKETFEPTTKSLHSICDAIPVAFFVSHAALDVAPIATAPAVLPSTYYGAKLYRCPRAESTGTS